MSWLIKDKEYGEYISTVEPVVTNGEVYISSFHISVAKINVVKVPDGTLETLVGLPSDLDKRIEILDMEGLVPINNFKVGNIVRVRGRDWYNSHKDSEGKVRAVGYKYRFTKYMEPLLGQSAVITSVNKHYYRVRFFDRRFDFGNVFCFCDFMLEPGLIIKVKPRLEGLIKDKAVIKCTLMVEKDTGVFRCFLGYLGFSYTG